MSKKPAKFLKLQTPPIAFIDWANVYKWKNSLKKEVDPLKILDYLKIYSEIKNTCFY